MTVAEAQLQVVRLAGGDAYQIVGGNRFAAAAVLGAVMGITVGWVGVALRRTENRPPDGAGRGATEHVNERT